MVLTKKDQRGNQKVNQDNTMVLKKSTKEVIRSRKSRDRQYNGIKEKVPKR